MELFTIVGLIVAFVGIIGGMMVEGGHPEALLDPAAFMIVIVGSLGSALVATKQTDIKVLVRAVKELFFMPKYDFQGTMDKILELANLARREGLLALEGYTTSDDGDPFLQSCLTFAIDGSSAEAIKETVEAEIYLREQEAKGIRRGCQSGSLLPPISPGCTRIKRDFIRRPMLSF